MTKTVTVIVDSPAYDMGQGIRAFLAATRKALSDGWQPGSDIPTIVLAAYTDLIPQIGNMSAVLTDVKIDAKDVVKAFTVCAEDIAADFFSTPSVVEL